MTKPINQQIKFSKLLMAAVSTGKNRVQIGNMNLYINDKIVASGPMRT